MKSGYEKKKKTKQYKIEHWNKPGAELANKDHPKKKTERERLLGGEGTSPPFSPHPTSRPCPHFSNTT